MNVLIFASGDAVDAYPNRRHPKGVKCKSPRATPWETNDRPNSKSPNGAEYIYRIN
ncbi:hypothetical protein GWN42_21965 [candidate division KSB1 bacterium]|nr:hypothetical protein [candidate division KSB1 bacterium]